MRRAVRVKWGLALGDGRPADAELWKPRLASWPQLHFDHRVRVGFGSTGLVGYSSAPDSVEAIARRVASRAARMVNGFGRGAGLLVSRSFTPLPACAGTPAWIGIACRSAEDRRHHAEIAPNNRAQMFLFLILSFSAGICEELVFRGYLQQQFARMGGRI
jgi:Type II CAAX prenyl endopeptidase Rce1-like